MGMDGTLVIELQSGVSRCVNAVSDKYCEAKCGVSPSRKRVGRGLIPFRDNGTVRIH